MILAMSGTIMTAFGETASMAQVDLHYSRGRLSLQRKVLIVMKYSRVSRQYPGLQAATRASLSRRLRFLAASGLGFTKTVATATLFAPARRLTCCEFHNHHDTP